METATNANNNKSLDVELSQSHGNVTTSDESLLTEVRGVRNNIIRPKHKVRIGTLNLGTMHEISNSSRS